MEGIRINGNMHHEKRVVILIGILSGICISLGFIRPFDGVITLSELVLQLSGSRGELSMSCNLVELIGFMLRMMPNYIMILVFGNKLYGAAFTLVMVVQMTCTAALSIINILTKMQIKQDIIYVFLWLNPVAHTVLGWHRSTLLEVELANSRYSLNLVTSILIPALFCIVTVLMGGQLIQKKDLLAEDMEMETI